MKIIIRKATVINPQREYHHKTVDIYVKDGIIEAIGDNLKVNSDVAEIAIDDLFVSPGWFDSSVSFGEPGFEDRETISNGLQVAAKSGFTSVALQPNMNPVADNQSAISFLTTKSSGFATDLYPIGALTKGSLGQDLAELYDMKNSGAIAFGDYNKSVENAGVMKIALDYVQDFGGFVIGFCKNAQLAGNGVVNEGAVAMRLGLKGIPSIAEESEVAKNIQLLEYTGGRIHVPTISTAKSVDMIRSAKAKGLQITCSVSVHHLVLSDETLETFDSRFKVSPPLRANEDRLALIEGVLDGSIDMITSDHNPIDIENKKMEFALAKNGTIGLESAFGALMTVLPLDVIIDKLTAGKRIFGIADSEIAAKSVANLTLFTPSAEWVFKKENIISKSKNSAFLGRQMKGKVHGIINNGKLVLSDKK